MLDFEIRSGWKSLMIKETMIFGYGRLIRVEFWNPTLEEKQSLV